MYNLKTQKNRGTEILRFLFSILLFTVLFSCTKTESEIKTINVLEPDESSLTISEIADDIEYIPLANDSLLGNIRKIVYSGGDYFVKDNTSKLLRFNEKGELLNIIGRRGNGPGEYNYVSDFVIHPETGNIFITGGKEYKIMVYSPEGKFLKSIPIPVKSSSSIGISSGNLFLYYLDGAQHNEENMYLIDTDGNSIKSYTNKYEFERGRAIMMFSGECLIYSLAGKLHFKELSSDTIFYLDGEKMIPETILNSGDKRFTPEKRSRAIQELSADPGGTSESMVNSITQNNLFETNNYLIYRYRRMLIYNKSTGEMVETDSREGIKNDWDGGLNIQLKTKKGDNTIFAWVNAFELKAHVATEAFKNATPKYPEKKKELEQLANSLDENDNPVLVLVKLKE